MPKLSMWKPERGQDYTFFDNRIREMFTVGGTGVNIHKFLVLTHQTIRILMLRNLRMLLSLRKIYKIYYF